MKHIFFLAIWFLTVSLFFGCSKSEQQLREERLAAKEEAQKYRSKMQADQQAAEQQFHDKMKADREKAKADYEVSLQKIREKELAYANNEFGAIRPNSPEFSKLNPEQRKLLKTLIPSVHERSIWKTAISKKERLNLDAKLIQLALPDLLACAEEPSEKSYAHFRQLLFSLEPPKDLDAPGESLIQAQERLTKLAQEQLPMFKKLQLTPEERVQVWLQLHLKPTEQFDALMKSAEIMQAGGALNDAQQSELKNHPVTSRAYLKFAK